METELLLKTQDDDPLDVLHYLVIGGETMTYSRDTITRIKDYLGTDAKFKYTSSVDVIRFSKTAEYVEYLIKDIGLTSCIIRLREDPLVLSQEYQLMEELSKEELSPEPFYVETDLNPLGYPFFLMNYEEIQAFERSELVKFSSSLGKLHALDASPYAYLPKRVDIRRDYLERAEKIKDELLKKQALDHDQYDFFEDFILWMKDRRVEPRALSLTNGSLQPEHMKRAKQYYFWNWSKAMLQEPMVEVCEFLSPINQVIQGERIYAESELEDFFLLYSRDYQGDLSEEYREFMPWLILHQWSELMHLRYELEELPSALEQTLDYLTDLHYISRELSVYL